MAVKPVAKALVIEYLENHQGCPGWHVIEAWTVDASIGELLESAAAPFSKSGRVGKYAGGCYQFAVHPCYDPQEVIAYLIDTVHEMVVQRAIRKAIFAEIRRTMVTGERYYPEPHTGHLNRYE